MRLAYYAGASTAAAAACLLKAFHQRPNFYSATVYLSQSNACLLILINLMLVMFCSFIYGLQRLLYGPLRPIEIEQLSEKAWYAVLDTLLAMPSFRENVGGWLLAMFTLLLASKVWGWIGEGRVDVLEQQPPANPRLFHLRLSTSLFASVAFNLWMLNFCVETVVRDPRPGMMVIFTFEFAILSVFSTFTLARYGLNVVGIRIEKKQLEKAIEERKEEIKAERAAARQNETEDGRPTPAAAPNDEPIEVDENEVDVPGWEEKRRYLFGLEVFTDFIKLLIYIVFFTISITFNGLPMHIMRDVYMTFASFSKRVGDYMAYRKATSDMNTRYPDATTEEIRGDSCIVCRETMVAWEQPAAQQDAQPAPAEQQPDAAPAPSRRRDEGLRAKKLPCGHILHLRCLKAWLERQQVCPTCRRPVVTADAPAQPAQPGAAGANPPAPGQQPQQPGRRQNRARIFDLGPVRIGFVNGPGANIPNIVRQMQDPNAAAAAAAAAAQNAAQQGQNQNQAGAQGAQAAGTQPPSIPNAGQMGASTSTTPIQMQLMQMEQRLMQDAHNLHLEQQQYTTLRGMEAELSRLRAMHMPAQQPVGTGNAAAAQRQLFPPFPQQMRAIGPFGAMNPPWMGQPQYAAPFRETLHGAPGQQLGNGHEHLPEGMTLPEGWTVTPLQRINDPSRAAPTMQPNSTQSTVHGSDAPTASATGAAPASGPAPLTTEAQRPTATQPASTVPRNENGSPLFAPTVAGSSDNADPAAQPAQTQTTQATPWDSQSWSFSGDNNGNGQPVTSQQATSSEEHQSSNGHLSGDDAAASDSRSETTRKTNLKHEESQSATNEESSSRTVHVEDVPDPGT